MTTLPVTTSRRGFFRAYVVPAFAAAIVVGGATLSTGSNAEANHDLEVAYPPEYYQGFRKGKLQGRKDGYEDGYRLAYKASYTEELNNPSIMMKKKGPDYFVIGYKKGYRVGYRIGWKQGKRAGRLDGREDAQAMRRGLREEMRRCMEEGICL